ncbi:MAG: hypothetical protein AB7I32_15975 [Gammaproteobacteria bacterium]
MKKKALSGFGLALCTMAATAQAPFDIVGLKLGMTEQEAMAALQAHEPTLNITRVDSYYNYTDGIETFQTDQFLGELRASRPNAQQAVPEFTLLFSPPPQGGRLWAVSRREKIVQNQPSFPQYVQALEQKYGKPTAVTPDNSSLSWDHPADQPRCLARDPQRPGFPTYRPQSDGSDLMIHLKAANQRNPSPPDYKTCGSQLYFILSTTGGEVVDNFEAIMYDIGHYVTASEAADAEVQALETKAREAREGKGQIPSL